MPNIGDVLGDQMTQVYENYSFNHAIDPQLLIHTYKEEVIKIFLQYTLFGVLFKMIWLVE